MKKYDAVFAGYICLDMIPRFEKGEEIPYSLDMLKPGKLLETGKMDIVLGGAVPNTGLLMKHFGKKVFLNGLTGNDWIGRIAEQCLAGYGCSGGIVKTSEEGTAYSIVIALPGVDRIFLESPGCNRIFDIGHIHFDAIAETRLFHFGYPPLLRQFYLDGGIRLTKLYRQVHEMGVITSLDFSLPDAESESGKVDWITIMQKTLPFVDVFAPSLEEVIQIMMPEKYAELQSFSTHADFEDRVPLSLVRELGSRIIQTGVSILLIKMGKRGMYLRTGNISAVNEKSENELHLLHWDNCEILCGAYHAENAKIKNSSGAGDTAIAAFLTSVLNGDDPGTAVRYAAAAGRDSLYCGNIFDGMSTWEELTREINSETNELNVIK